MTDISKAPQATEEDKFFPASTEAQVRQALLGRIKENLDQNGDREDFRLLTKAYTDMFVSHEVHRVESMPNGDTLVLVETLMALYHEVSRFINLIEGESGLDQTVKWRINRVKEALLAVQL